jgi:hypothetical protein
MDEQVQHRFVRDGYAILPAGTMPVGLAEAAQAQHSTALLMAALVVQVAPSAWAAIEQLPEIHRTVPSKAHGKHGLKPTVQQTFTFKPTVVIPHHRVHDRVVHQKLSGGDVAEVNTALVAEATHFKASPPHWRHLMDLVRFKFSESCGSHTHTRIDQLVRFGVLRLDEPDGPNYAVAYGV